MSTPLARWLDADRAEGVEIARLTREQIDAAHGYRYIQVLSLLSQRSFEVTALRYIERDPECFGVFTVTRGCVRQLMIHLSALEEGDEGPDVAHRFPYRGAWPTRLLNPARQNLDFRLEGTLRPIAVEVHWRHVAPHKESSRPMTSTKNAGVTSYAKADVDEPLFVLRAQDKLAPEVVREWAYRAHVSGAPIEKVREARHIADQMEEWQVENRRKVPD